ncbi:hypothetical protein GCM10010425_71350 [Streptomyces spororaveus]|uniref:Thiamine pyrophosphate enzyme TPP-binding domain-containing protein n=1 Tax=Streptomyces spororaveus TaxID=284039 RepID=A0ABQ3T970_9ACTN|nr:hypothetical protein Sspor_24880 [Streptomyces spororaveus]
MPVGDFLPLVQYDPLAEVVLFDNSSLGTAESETSVSGLPSRGATNRNPDVAGLARAAGAYGVRVERPQQLTGALKGAVRHRGPLRRTWSRTWAPCRFLRRPAPER